MNAIAPLTLAHWLAGSALFCAGGFALHWIWQRCIAHWLQSRWGIAPPAVNDTIPLSVWPGAFIALATFGGLFFIGNIAGF